jgi:recombination protein RecA
MEKKVKLDNTDSKQKDFEKLLQTKMKSLGIDSKCIKTGDVEAIKFVSTGVFEIDTILGGAGLPEGTLVEFCGESQSGKTYLAYKFIAEAQNQGKKCVFFNIENSYYPPRAIACGVNIEELTIIENVSSAEQYGELIEAFIDSGLYGVVVIDSITAMIPQDEVHKTYEQAQTIGLHARFVKRLTKNLVAKTAASQCICVLINQLYMGAGAMPGSMALTASGGNAMNYFTHVRLWFRKINGAAGQVVRKDEEGKDEIIGGKSAVVVQKTRYGQPGQRSEFKIMFGEESDTNPVDEFLYRAKAKGSEYIKEVRKKFSYVNADTGEVVESKNPIEFIKMLMNQPAPEKRTRGDNSATAFEYIVGRLRITGKPLDDLMQQINSEDDMDFIEDEDGIQLTEEQLKALLEDE